MLQAKLSEALRAIWKRWDVCLTIFVMIFLSAWSPGRSNSELAVIGGGLYLINKIFLNIMERRRRLTDAEPFWFWRRWAWAVYLMGLPPFVALFVNRENWIFAAIEVGGVPAMLCGLVTAMNRRDPPVWLQSIAGVAVIVGMVLSLWNLEGLSRPLTQGLESAGGIGFLLGTILLAQDNEKGYKFFLLMNLATGALFYIQGDYIIAVMQAISIFIVLDGQRVKKKFSRVPQIADLDELAWKLAFPLTPWPGGYPGTFRLWNGWLAEVSRANEDDPVDFEQGRGGHYLFPDDLRPFALRLAEGESVVVRIPSGHPYYGPDTYRWRRYEEK